tara:strand:- start:117 stop:341 length:225 start_codon:yes stop_codon:yes gene_type:complete
MKLKKGDLVTVEPQPIEDIMSGQQYFTDIIKETNYLGVVTRLKGRYTEVMWLRHPTRTNLFTSMRTVTLKKVIV